jgi:hypothetical protein
MVPFPAAKSRMFTTIKGKKNGQTKQKLAKKVARREQLAHL